MDKKIYYRELGRVQNLLKTPIDIITFTGFMDDDEKMAHLERYAAEVNYKINLD